MEIEKRLLLHKPHCGNKFCLIEKKKMLEPVVLVSIGWLVCEKEISYDLRTCRVSMLALCCKFMLVYVV